jgi:hypothetical protein
MYGTLYHPE